MKVYHTHFVFYTHALRCVQDVDMDCTAMTMVRRISSEMEPVRSGDDDSSKLSASPQQNQRVDNVDEMICDFRKMQEHCFRWW
jgi:hypothetical protein